MDEIQKTKKSGEHAPDWFTNLLWTDPKRPINPYGEHPISDYLVATDAALSKFKPFSGVDDQMNVLINKATGIGPQTKRDLEEERYNKMLRSEAGTITGGLLGTAANALLPSKAIPYSMGLGAVEGVFSDPDRALSPEGAAWGTGLAGLPLLKFLKLDPRGMIPENFVRTMAPRSNELQKFDIVRMIGEQLPREAGSVWGNLKNRLMGKTVPTTMKKVTETMTKKAPIPVKSQKNFYETGSRLMGLQERKIAGKLGDKNYISPYANEARDLLKQAEGVTLGTFASASAREAVPHEGIHAAIRAASEKSGVKPRAIEDAASKIMAIKYPEVFSGVSHFINAKGYPVNQMSPEFLPHLHGILSEPKERADMIRISFGGNERAYQNWAHDAKRAYKEIVKWAKDVTPADIEKMKSVKPGKK